MIKMERCEIPPLYTIPDDYAEWREKKYRDDSFSLKWDEFEVEEDEKDDFSKMLVKVKGVYRANSGRYGAWVGISKHVTDIFEAAAACRQLVEKWARKKAKKKKKK